MSIKKKAKWECLANHLPEWIDELDVIITTIMSEDDGKRTENICDRYNELCRREQDNNEDGFSLYGVESEKEDLVNEFINIHEKYRHEAAKLLKQVV